MCRMWYGLRPKEDSCTTGPTRSGAVPPQHELMAATRCHLQQHHAVHHWANNHTRHVAPVGRRPTVSCRASKAPAAAEAAVQQLLSAVEGTQCGLQTPDSKQKQIMELVESLKAANPTAVTTGSDLSATWRLLWTTEKETLFILKNAGWFGTKAGEVYQVIDTQQQYLQNVITFPPDGAFIVNSSISIDGPQRTQFKFTSATLKLPSRSINVPPFGQGWFDTVYLDDQLRVAQDIRGDTLIVARDGPPRRFT